MGEYATYKGESVKIGTCEDMYYLRADQRDLVQPEPHSLNPNGEEQYVLRFRFPFPDEDHIEPGGFDNYDRWMRVPDNSVPIPEGIKHHSVQFSARNGYLVSLPCPESLPIVTVPMRGECRELTPDHMIGLNGYGGRVSFGQQKILKDGRAVLVCRCNGCGTAWRLEDWSDAEPIVVALRSEADRCGNDARVTYNHEIADRIAQGYGEGPNAA